MEKEIMEMTLKTITAIVSIIGLFWTIRWAIRGARLKIALLDARGYSTKFGDTDNAPPVYFYHIRVKNTRKWTANNVRIKVTKFVKEGKGVQNDSYRVPVYLIWATHPSPKSYLIDILGFDDEICNLGYIMEKEKMFKIDAMDPARFSLIYKWPPNFQGFIENGETLHVEMVAIAENVRSNILKLKITWDGQWCATADEMQKHLIVSVQNSGLMEKVYNRLNLSSLFGI